jgi:hypothetical protein
VFTFLALKKDIAVNQMFLSFTGDLPCYFLLNPANTHTSMVSLLDRNVNKKDVINII